MDKLFKAFKAEGRSVEYVVKKKKIYIVDRISGKTLHEEDLDEELKLALIERFHGIVERESESICTDSFDPNLPIDFEIKGRNLVRIHHINILIHKNGNEFINQVFTMNYHNGEGWLSKNRKDCSKDLGNSSNCSSKMTLILEKP